MRVALASIAPPRRPKQRGRAVNTRRVCALVLSATVTSNHAVAGRGNAQGNAPSEASIEHQSAPCARPPASSFSVGRTVTLPDTRPPCRIQFVETRVAVRADTLGMVGGIGGMVARSRDGRFYTSWNEEVTIWNPNGSYLRTFGRRGAGPGELAVGGKFIYIDSLDRVYIRDDNMRWTVFTRDDEFVATRTASDMGFHNRSSALLDDGSFLTAQPVARQNAFFFSLYDFGIGASSGSAATGGGSSAANSPVLLRAFGPVPASEHGVNLSGRQRPLAHARGDVFWVGPPRDAGRGYELEMWRTDGVHLRTLRRHVSWLPSASPRITMRGAPQQRPGPGISGLHVDSAGLLYVTAGSVNDKWTPGADVADFLEIYFDVIDPDAGRVLASIGPLAYADALATLPAGFFPGSRVGYRLAPGPNGEHGMQMVETRLIRQ